MVGLPWSPDEPPWIMVVMSYVRLEDLDDERRQIPAWLLAVPAIRQRAAFSCGPAALLSVLRYWGVPVVDECRLYDRLGTQAKGGTRPGAIAAVAREHGLRAEARQLVTHDDLAKAVGRGETVILSLQRWGAALPDEECEDGHFVVLAGLDDEDVWVMDPYVGAFAWMPVSDLLDRWHDRAWPGEPCERRVAIFAKGRRTHPEPPTASLASRYR